MRVCQFRHDGKWTSIVATAQGRRIRKTCTSILQAGLSLSNDLPPCHVWRRCHPTCGRDVILKRAGSPSRDFAKRLKAIQSPRSCPLDAPGVPNQPHRNFRLTYGPSSGLAAVQDDISQRATAIKQPLLQLRVHRDLRVEHLRNRTALLGRLGILLEGRCVRARHLAHNINVAGSNRPP